MIAAPTAAAQSRTPTPSAKELWRNYPLDASPEAGTPTPASGDRPASAPAGARAQGGERAPAEEGGAPIPLLGGAGLLIVLAGTAVVLRRRRGRRPAHTPIGWAAPLLPVAAATAMAPAGRPRPPRLTALGMDRHPAGNEPAEQSDTARPPDPRRAWTAEVEWRDDGRGPRFCVVARAGDTDAGVPILTSPPLEWPPADAEAVQRLTRAAERLESALLTAGWSPLPAGSAWYAKRFAWAAATEPATAAVTEPPRPAVTEPATAAATEPPRPAVTEPATAAATEPPRPAVTEPATAAAMEPATAAATEPATAAATEPPRPAATEPATAAATEPPRPAATEPASAAATEPPRPAATEPAGAAATEPASAAATEPPRPAVTEPASAAATEPPRPAVTQPAPPERPAPPPAPARRAAQTALAEPGSSGRFKRQLEWPPRSEEGWRCEIRWHPGYVNSRFEAVALAPNRRRGTSLGRSEPFKWLMKTDPAPAAPVYAAQVRRLAEGLVAAGWKAAGRGRHWYELRFVWEGDDPPSTDLVLATAEAGGARAGGPNDGT